MDLKHQRKESSIEAMLHPLISNLISEYGVEIPSVQVWESIKCSIHGYQDEKRPNEYHTSEYGTIYRIYGVDL